MSLSPFPDRKELVTVLDFGWLVGWCKADQALLVNFTLFFFCYYLCPPGLSVTQYQLIYQIQVYLSRTSIRSIMASFSLKDQGRPHTKTWCTYFSLSCSKQNFQACGICVNVLKRELAPVVWPWYSREIPTLNRSLD